MTPCESSRRNLPLNTEGAKAMSFRSAKHAKAVLSCCLSAAAVALTAPAARAASIYIGDDAAEGKTITAGGGAQADTANPLTYAFTGTGSTYTAATAQT